MIAVSEKRLYSSLFLRSVSFLFLLGAYADMARSESEPTTQNGSILLAVNRYGKFETTQPYDGRLCFLLASPANLKLRLLSSLLLDSLCRSAGMHIQLHLTQISWQAVRSSIENEDT